MTTLVLRKLLRAILTLWIVVTLTFVVLHTAGDDRRFPPRFGPGSAAAGAICELSRPRRPWRSRQFLLGEAAAWWMAVLPGVALSLTTLAAGLIGDSIRDRLHPTLN